MLLTESIFKAGTSFTVSANDGLLDADDAHIDAGEDILLEAQGDMLVERATLRTPGPLVFDVKEVSNQVRIGAAVIDDADDVAKVMPDGATVVGTPASGSWS